MVEISSHGSFLTNPIADEVAQWVRARTLNASIPSSSRENLT